MASSARPLRCSTVVQARRSATEVVWGRLDVQRNGLIDSGGQGGEIPQFLALRANRTDSKRYCVRQFHWRALYTESPS